MFGDPIFRQLVHSKTDRDRWRDFKVIDCNTPEKVVNHLYRV